MVRLASTEPHSGFVDLHKEATTVAKEALSFGAFIRERRNERGLTLLDVAAALEISIPYLSRIERDREKTPRDELIRRLAKILRIPEDDAFAAASRLPPDLQSRAAEIFALYRRLSR